MRREPNWDDVYAAAVLAVAEVAKAPDWVIYRAVNAAFAEYESQMHGTEDQVPWDQLELQVQTEDSDETLTSHE